MNSRSTFSTILHSIFRVVSIVLLLSAAAQPQSIFWESDLQSACASRDSFFRVAGIDISKNVVQPAVPTASIPDADTLSPWYLFVRGIETTKESPATGADYFARALDATGKDPGQTWVLAREFARIGQVEWQEKARRKQHLLFLLSGAQSAPIISQQLLHDGFITKNKADFEYAQYFDRHLILPAIIDIKEIGFTNPSKTASLIRDLYDVITSSWEHELVLSSHFINWFILVCKILTVAIILGLCFTYLPRSLHRVAEYLPDAYASRIKICIAIIIFFSAIWAGPLFLIWLIFFFIWKHIAGNDKILAFIALALFFLFPFALHISDMLNQCRSPDSSITLFRKSIDEGYYQSLDSIISIKCKTANRDYLAHCAAAIIGLKKGDIASVYPHIRAAQQASTNDPAVILTAGNALFTTGDLTGARNAYQQCIKLYPKYEPAYFNLGQYFFNSMETAKGMEYLSLASKLNPLFVNTFIKTNDVFFSKDWPLIRQLMQPEYSSAYFWEQLFPKYAGTWETTDKRFGASFFGFPILWYICISLILFVLLIGLDVFFWSKQQVKTIFSCKLCGASICRKCKRGGICHECFSTSQHIRNESIRERIMSKIQMKNKTRKIIITAFLDMFFPGLGMQINKQSLVKTIPALLFTSMIFGCMIVMHSVSFEYPLWAIHDLFLPVMIAFAVYFIFFFSRSVLLIINSIRKGGE